MKLRLLVRWSQDVIILDYPGGLSVFTWSIKNRKWCQRSHSERRSWKESSSGEIKHKCRLERHDEWECAAQLLVLRWRQEYHEIGMGMTCRRWEKNLADSSKEWGPQYYSHMEVNSDKSMNLEVDLAPELLKKIATADTLISVLLDIKPRNQLSPSDFYPTEFWENKSVLFQWMFEFVTMHYGSNRKLKQ